jgi:hypothetical protein
MPDIILASTVADKTGVADAAVAIQTAASAANVGEIVFDAGGTFKIASSVTWPKGVKYTFLKGAKLTRAASAVLRIEGPVHAGDFKIFDAGSGFIKGVRTANAHWWGLSTATSADNAPAFQAQHDCMIDAQTSDGEYLMILPVGTWYCRQGITWTPLGYFNPVCVTSGSLNGGFNLVAAGTDFSGSGPLLTIGEASTVSTTDFVPPPMALKREAGSACEIGLRIRNNVSFRHRTWRGLYVNGLTAESDGFLTSVQFRGNTTLWCFEDFGVFSKRANAVIWDLASIGSPVADLAFGKGRSVVDVANGGVHFKITVDGASFNGLNIQSGYHFYGGQALSMTWNTAHNIGDIFIAEGAQMDSMGPSLILARPSQGQLFNLQMTGVYATQATSGGSPGVNAIDVARSGTARISVLDFSSNQIVGFSGRVAYLAGVEGLVVSNNRLGEIGGGTTADSMVFLEQNKGLSVIGNVYGNPPGVGPHPASMILLLDSNSYATVVGNAGNGVTTVVARDGGGGASSSGTKVVLGNI